MGLGNALIGVLLDWGKYDGTLTTLTVQPGSVIMVIKGLYVVMPVIIL